jgi:hypothetical protein
MFDKKIVFDGGNRDVMKWLILMLNFSTIPAYKTHRCVKFQDKSKL